MDCLHLAEINTQRPHYSDMVVTNRQDLSLKTGNNKLWPGGQARSGTMSVFTFAKQNSGMLRWCDKRHGSQNYRVRAPRTVYRVQPDYERRYKNRMIVWRVSASRSSS